MIKILEHNVKRRGIVVDKVRCSCGVNYYTNNLEEDYRCKKCRSIADKIKTSQKIVYKEVRADIKEYQEQLHNLCYSEKVYE